MLVVPSMVSEDLISMSSATQITVSTNREAIAIDQDPGGQQATPHSSSSGSGEVWVKLVCQRHARRGETEPYLENVRDHVQRRCGGNADRERLSAAQRVERRGHQHHGRDRRERAGRIDCAVRSLDRGAGDRSGA